MLRVQMYVCVCVCPLFTRSVTTLCGAFKYLMACNGFFSIYAVFAYLYAFKANNCVDGSQWIP